jgi:chromosome partitioning protein
MRYAVVFTKGGVGKTTVAVNLAGHLCRQASTLLIDGDPQESAATWAAWRKDSNKSPTPTTVRLRGTAITDEGVPLSENFTHTVIDAGGRDGAGLRNALLLADKVIVPMGNSGLDAAVLDDFLMRVEEARSFNKALDVRVLFNRIPARSDLIELKDFVKERGITWFKQTIGERRIYAKATSSGLTTDEYRPKIAAATFELRNFFEEIKQWK